jgi:hypothetical protein
VRAYICATAGEQSPPGDKRGARQFVPGGRRHWPQAPDGLSKGQAKRLQQRRPARNRQEQQQKVGAGEATQRARGELRDDQGGQRPPAALGELARGVAADRRMEPNEVD